MAPKRRRATGQAPIVAVIAVGGAIGACARYGVTLWWPTMSPAFPWPILLVNVTGCALMGIVMALITEYRAGHRLLRPFLGTGILGGYTTFSTYTVDITHLVDDGNATQALAYLVLTPVVALAATWTTASLVRQLLTRRTR